MEVTVSNGVRAWGRHKGDVWVREPIGKGRGSGWGPRANGASRKGEHSRWVTYKVKRGRKANGPTGLTELEYVYIEL